MVSKEQISCAKKLDLLDYLKNHEPDELVADGAGQYCTASHDSLKIRGGLWYWNSQKIGGRSALDYLVKVRGMGFTSAVEMLCCCGYSVPPKMMKEPTQSLKTTSELADKNGFTLPKAALTFERVFQYLKGRGIEESILRQCFSAGVLYESLPYHNCVFVGRDEHGMARYAALRGVFSHFHGEHTQSDKRYGFVYAPPGAEQNTAKCVSVCESPIDVLSCASFALLSDENKAEKAYLALGGLSGLALWQYLENNAQVKEIHLCLDADNAGKSCANGLEKELTAKGYAVIVSPPPVGKDWNEALCLHKGMKKACSKAKSKDER